MPLNYVAIFWVLIALPCLRILKDTPLKDINTQQEHLIQLESHTDKHGFLASELVCGKLLCYLLPIAICGSI